MEERRGFHQLTYNEQEYLHLLQVGVERAEAAVERGRRFQLSKRQLQQLEADLEAKKEKLRKELFRVLGSAKPVPVDAAVFNPHPLQGDERLVSDDLRLVKAAYFKAVFEGQWDDARQFREAIEELNGVLVAMDADGDRAGGTGRRARAGEAQLHI